MRKKKRNWLLIILILAVIAIGAVKGPGVYREVSFGWAERSAAEQAVWNYAEEKGISYGAYPASLIDLLERNPETAGFVLNYPFREEQTIDMGEFDRSAGVPLMMQWDTRWGYMRYGSDVVGLTGCGPVCLAMAGYYVTGDEKFAPDKMVEFSLENGYCVPGKGTAWTLISEGGERLGLDVTEIPPGEAADHG